ncbi:hypothetical protein IAU59_002079 [Kwoniella sp. CBS 9459]
MPPARTNTSHNRRQSTGVFYMAEAEAPMTFYVLGGSMAITWAIERAGGIVCVDSPGTPPNERTAAAHVQRIIFNRDNVPTAESLCAATAEESSILEDVEGRGGWQMVLSSDWIFHCLREGGLVDTAAYNIKGSRRLMSPARTPSTVTAEENDNGTMRDTSHLNDTTTASQQRPLFSSFFDNQGTASRPIPTGPRFAFNTSTPLLGKPGSTQPAQRTGPATLGPMRSQHGGAGARQRAGPGYNKRPAKAPRPFANNQDTLPPMSYFVPPTTPGLDPNVSLAASLLQQSLATLRASNTLSNHNNAASHVPLINRISGPAQSGMSIDDAITLLAKRLAVWTKRLGRRPGKKVLKKYLENVRIQGCPTSCKNVWLDHRHKVYAEMVNEGINTADWPLKLKLK